jgi:hypothetical protein
MINLRIGMKFLVLEVKNPRPIGNMERMGYSPVILLYIINVIMIRIYYERVVLQIKWLDILRDVISVVAVLCSEYVTAEPETHNGGLRRCIREDGDGR